MTPADLVTRPSRTVPVPQLRGRTGHFAVESEGFECGAPGVVNELGERGSIARRPGGD
jgi:hypothetical protein